MYDFFNCDCQGQYTSRAKYKQSDVTNYKLKLLGTELVTNVIMEAQNINNTQPIKRVSHRSSKLNQ